MPFFSGMYIVGDEIGKFFDLAAFFLVGMLYYSYRKTIVLDRFLAMLSIVGLFLSLLYGGFRECFAVAGSYLIFYLAYHPQIKFWNFAKYGDLSYGIYVYAFPVQQFMVWYNNGKLSPLADCLYSYPIILVLAFTSWHLVEKQTLKLKQYFRYEWFDTFLQSLRVWILRSSSRLNSSEIWRRGFSSFRERWIGLNWASFGVAFCCLVFITMRSIEQPTFIEFPDSRYDELMAGGWHPQSVDEKHRWVNESASIQLSLPRKASKVRIQGYLPPNFTEVTEAKAFINGAQIGIKSLTPGSQISFELPIPKDAFAQISVKVGVWSNGIHIPTRDAADKRSLSALITRIAIE